MFQRKSPYIHPYKYIKKKKNWTTFMDVKH